MENFPDEKCPRPTGPGAAFSQKDFTTTGTCEQEVHAALARGWCLTCCEGKRPFVKDWPNKRLDKACLLAHARKGGNIAVVTGAASGIVVIDLDGDVEQHADLLERLPIGPSVRTPSGGVHLYFKDPGGLKNTVSRYAAHVDIRADSGCAVLPGSRTEKGTYEWVVHPDGVELPDLPGWFLDGLKKESPPPRQAAPTSSVTYSGRTPRAAAALEYERQTVASSSKGTRNPDLNSAAFSLGTLVGAGELDESDAVNGLLDANLCRSEPLKESEARAAIQSGMTAGKKSPRIPQETRSATGVTSYTPEALKTPEGQQGPQNGQEVKTGPQIECAAQYRGAYPTQRPELFHGLLREGHLAAISGPSKSGKSFALIAAALAVAGGGRWFSFRAEQGPALVINPEIDGGSMWARVNSVREHHPAPDDNVHLLNLRGALPPGGIDGLVTLILRELDRTKVQMRLICLDSVYRLHTGDENGASDIAHLLTALETLAQRTGAAVMLSHHFSKGGAARPDMLDRSSGSGVFGRAPDAVMTLSPLTAPGCYRLESVLREFASPEPSEWEFSWPRHLQRTDLSGCGIKGAAGRPKLDEAAGDDVLDELLTLCRREGVDPTQGVAAATLADHLGCSIKTLRRRADMSGLWDIRRGFAVVLDEEAV